MVQRITTIAANPFAESWSCIEHQACTAPGVCRKDNEQGTLVGVIEVKKAIPREYAGIRAAKF